MPADDRTRYRKTCDCDCGAYTQITRSYVYRRAGGADVPLRPGDVPVCFLCRKEWKEVINERSGA